MRVLVVGSGGREHAAVWKLSQSPLVTKLFCAPGNGGIAALAECVEIGALDIAAMTAFAVREKIDLCAVLSDDPQAAGMVDAMQAAGIKTFGATQAAARIESSKVFSKNLMREYGIPTAAYETFTDVNVAVKYIETQKMPIVIKCDGLALGKGVIIAQSTGEAENAVRDMMENGLFAEAGRNIVIEEYMEGREVTVLAFTDGHSISLMPASRDHKRIGDGDSGPNTGGMGVISPVPDYTPEMAEQAMREIFLPTLAAMRSEGCPFTGVLYFGLMLTADGPKVIEYNARFGDPEAQVVLRLLESDLADIMLATIDGTLDQLDIRYSGQAAAIVMLASAGYPNAVEKGFPISGLDTVSEGTVVFHSGTKLSNGAYLTNGGRVLGVSALGDNLSQALGQVYGDCSRIAFAGMQYRTDIGKRELQCDC